MYGKLQYQTTQTKTQKGSGKMKDKLDNEKDYTCVLYIVLDRYWAIALNVNDNYADIVAFNLNGNRWEESINGSVKNDGCFNLNSVDCWHGCGIRDTTLPLIMYSIVQYYMNDTTDEAFEYLQTRWGLQNIRITTGLKELENK